MFSFIHISSSWFNDLSQHHHTNTGWKRAVYFLDIGWLRTGCVCSRCRSWLRYRVNDLWATGEVMISELDFRMKHLACVLSRLISRGIIWLNQIQLQPQGMLGIWGSLRTDLWLERCMQINWKKGAPFTQTVRGAYRERRKTPHPSCPPSPALCSASSTPRCCDVTGSLRNTRLWLLVPIYWCLSTF